ncbi:IS256 family transposase [Salisediminibacterium halotolerans]|uniref:IS256 family transposase n=1 Tax=Salisediminibacterium halotolerans TaxID=517425 RepID=UPI000EAD1064|nr:IS256 family transposase [Salisediminibacterium halotolerans]RLJ75716.1 putative transposase [Actinophytocola xinjiangensis]RPE89570.1 putative transposase [Salisediminibacterium halotolerans]TWG36329.1 putative transposase [Salisediminibacterium halotolerans]GEL07223.1 IS256 family transposase [Salisediminibacterium halotolerans]
MLPSIGQNNLENQLDEMVRSFVQEKLETIKKEEMNQFFEENPELKNYKNGSYHRQLDTKYGRIEDLQVPRDRENAFQTEMFQPYQRYEQWLGETIIAMYQKGMSTREIGNFLERILGHTYVPGTISHITNVVIDDIRAWQERPLQKRYTVLYLDGTYLKLRRDDVANEVVYVVIGVTEDGYREILGFYVGGQESSLGWEEVLLGIFDGLPGLEEAMKTIFPKADVQRCVIHKVRNTLNKVRKKDRFAISEDMRAIYQSNSDAEAKEELTSFCETWQTKYPAIAKTWREDIHVLTTFLKYPWSIRPMIYTTNMIERTMKELKKRLKTMNSLPSEEAVEKVIYVISEECNAKWATRKLRGFKEASSELNTMFEERYGF